MLLGVDCLKVMFTVHADEQTQARINTNYKQEKNSQIGTGLTLTQVKAIYSQPYEWWVDSVMGGGGV